MTPEFVTSFLTYYVRSLAERTRTEKTSRKYGFDWIIFNLAMALGLTPIRLPFFRGGPDELSKTKTEPELGIDFSFLSPDEQRLVIFVLKDEELCNSTWTANDFDSDLRKAAYPNLDGPEFKNVNHVQIILAYNKDEDQVGIRLYTNLTKSFGTSIRDNVERTFDRWNLTTIVELVQDRLLNPSLLPEKFFSLFSYICSQVADFTHGSDEWEKQLVPNWKRFLDDLLENKTDERLVRLIPVSLLILRKQGENNPSIETGWLDLTEWGMLAMWRVFLETPNEEIKRIVLCTYVEFYLAELEGFYCAHASEITTEHGLTVIHQGLFYLNPIASSMITFWHIGRLGILSVALYEGLSLDFSVEEQQALARTVHQIANWVKGLLGANPGAFRPLLDIHHIELFLIWRIFWQTGRKDDIYYWLLALKQRLLVRRLKSCPLPFIEANNSLELVYEYIADGNKPADFCDKSSVLLMILLELCFSLEPARRNELVADFYQNIIAGDETIHPINLMLWLPPPDWERQVFAGSVAQEGVCVTVAFESTANSEASDVFTQIENFVRECRSKYKVTISGNIPASALILACLKHKSPLPPEFWRQCIFEPIENDGQPPSENAATPQKKSPKKTRRSGK